MAQGLFGGATSYEEQSKADIIEDIDGWIEYTKSTKELLLKNKGLAVKNGFWNKVGYDFKMELESSIKYFDTILFDMDIIKDCIAKNAITEREVNLLFKIGKKAIEFNHLYGVSYHGDDRWQDYGNPDFEAVEEMYCHGRDFFVTLQDATNAAARLENYMEKGQVVHNLINVHGNVTGTQIQQGTTNSTQTLNIESNFDYEAVLTTLYKILKTTQRDDFVEDIGDSAGAIEKSVKHIAEMVELKEEPSKIKIALQALRDLAIGVSGSVIATGICGLISQLPIW